MSKDPDFIDVEVVSPGGKNPRAHPEDAASSVDPRHDPLFQLIARLLDDVFRIPGTNIRFGLDPLLGLIPGLGDSSSAVVSALLLVRGARAGLPRIVLLRMAGNILINAAVGSIPGLGDAFSVWFKSNRLNYELYQKNVTGKVDSHRTDWFFVGGLLAGIVLVVGFFIVLSLTLFAALWRLAWGG